MRRAPAAPRARDDERNELVLILTLLRHGPALVARTARGVRARDDDDARGQPQARPRRRRPRARPARPGGEATPRWAAHAGPTRARPMASTSSPSSLGRLPHSVERSAVGPPPRGLGLAAAGAPPSAPPATGGVRAAWSGTKARAAARAPTCPPRRSSESPAGRRRSPRCARASRADSARAPGPSSRP